MINGMFSAIFWSIALMVVSLSCLIACFKPKRQDYSTEGIEKPLVLASCKFCNASIENGFDVVYEVNILAI